MLLALLQGLYAARADFTHFWREKRIGIAEILMPIASKAYKCGNLAWLFSLAQKFETRNALFILGSTALFKQVGGPKPTYKLTLKLVQVLLAKQDRLIFRALNTV